MEIYVIDKDLTTVGLVDSFTSAVWINRYFKAGEFELCLPISAKLIQLLQVDYYLCRTSDIENNNGDIIYRNTMIIENIQIKSDVESGNYMYVSGKSLKTILNRRVVWQQTNLAGKVDLCIKRLIVENAVSPLIPQRIMNGLQIGEMVQSSESLEMQITGDNLNDVISELCEKYGYGYDVYIKNDKFVFRLYQGEDRSYNQDKNPYVVFSPEFENLLNTDYSFRKSEYKNIALVAGEGEGLERKTTVVGNAAGFERYEKYVDARDVSSNNGEFADTEYMKMLIDKGVTSLEESKAIESFDGSTETRISYGLNKDYFLGDIVQVINEYGIEASPRILEIMEGEDENGITIVPTFSTLEVG